MATWVPSAFISDIRGKIGGQVFSFQKGTHYIRAHNPNPDQPNTAAQQAVRGNLSNISAWWYTLSDPEQRMWNKFASLKKAHLSGYNAFVGVNMSLYTSGIPSPPRRNWPPLTPDTPTALSNFQVVSGSPTQNTLSWDFPNDASLYVQTWKSYDWNYYGGYNQMWVIQSATLSTALSYVHNHDTPGGARIWYRARSIDLWGRKSPFTHTVKQTTPTTPWLWLREHREQAVPYIASFEVSTFYGNPDIKVTTNNAVGDTCIFFSVQKAWLDGKKVKCRVQQTVSDAGLKCRVALFDGKYEGDNDTTFPDQAPFALFGAGLLHNALLDAGPTAWTVVEWSPDVSAAEEDYVTIMFWGDSDASTGAYWWLDYMQVLTAEDELLLDFVVDSLTMVRTGTFMDYGYTGTGP